jgi:septal ring factor EnvC (AmiA/AmiB activator)
MKLSNKLFLIVTILLLSVFMLKSQSREELEATKRKKEKEIELTKKLIQETSQEQRKSLSFLTVLKKQITTREELIVAYQKEIKYINEQISETQDIISSLKKDLENLKEEYAQMVVFAFRNRNAYDKIGFILSAESFNQSIRRLRLLQNYAENRQKQMELIEETKKSIEEKLLSLNLQKKQKQEVLNRISSEREELRADISKQSKLVDDLKTKESQLKKDLKLQQKQASDLDKKIAEIIRQQAKSSGYASTPEAKKLSLEFANNRGKLPWPVDNGFISETFGKHKHPHFDDVYLNNNGVNIRTAKNSNAMVVFKGEVRNVVDMPGMGTSVLVRHGGNYFTLYSNLKDVTVKVGDFLNTRQVIGKVAYNNKKGATEIHIEIWNYKEGQDPVKLNPSIWLKR